MLASQREEGQEAGSVQIEDQVVQMEDQVTPFYSQVPGTSQDFGRVLS
jgi:hypothetical protein